MFKFNTAKLKKASLLLVLILCGLITGCNNNRVNSVVPYVYVSFRIFPYSLDNTLNPMGGFKYFYNEGYNGVFVYRMSSADFLAYDCACPNDYEKGCQVSFDPNEFVLICPCCKTRFNLFTGFPENNEENPNILCSYSVTPLSDQDFLVSNL